MFNARLARIKSAMLSTSIFSLLSCVLSCLVPEATSAQAVTNVTYVFLKHESHYLNVLKIGTYKVYDTFDCTFECLQIPLCVSVNLAASKGADAKLWCELLYSDKYRSFTEYKGNESSHHFSIKSPCYSTPCQNGGTCVANYKEDTFNCLCEKENGFIGEHCETAAKSCTELYDAYKLNTSQLVTLRFGQTPTPVFCHFGDFGCGDGVWTTVMKIDGNKNTFHYDSTYWSDGNEYNLSGGETGFDVQETKLPTYWNTLFSRICLGMKISQQTNFIAINKQANSLYSLIADGQYRATSLGRNTWKALIGSEASLQTNCNKEGFNAVCTSSDMSKARIGITSNEQSECTSCDSRIGFGTAGIPDNSNTCGNVATAAPDNGNRYITAMGYILVQ
ncbi:hypothetical protein ACROYT_G004958 [Oculina patagonica]